MKKKKGHLINAYTRVDRVERINVLFSDVAQLQNVAHTRIENVCVSVLWRALEPRRGELRRRRGPGQVVQFVRALAVDHPSPRERACGEGPCFPVHHHAFQYFTCTVL